MSCWMSLNRLRKDVLNYEILQLAIRNKVNISEKEEYTIVSTICVLFI